MPSARQTVARYSRGPLLYLVRLPRWLVLGVSLAVLLVGLFAHGLWSAVPLIVLGAFLGWLLYLSWPSTSPWGRLARTVVVLALLAGGVYRVGG